MELYSIDGELSVLHCHDLPLLRPGNDPEHVGNRVRIRRQGVIAGYLRLRRAVPKQRGLRIQLDHRLLAVHQSFGVSYLGSEGRTDRLMAQTDSQDRAVLTQFLRRLQGDSGILGPAGTGRKDHPFRL